jgi:hydroxyacylglutathione hydrolase
MPKKPEPIQQVFTSGPVHLFLLPVLKDNYIYVWHDKEQDLTFCVDPSLSEPVEYFLNQQGWELSYILITHHHWDHTDGVRGLQERYPDCITIGYAHDTHRLPPLNMAVNDGETITIGSYTAKVMAIPGHTTGHIAFYFPTLSMLFCGDTLFAMGCGRLFEGTPEQMYSSLKNIARLSEDTLVCCAHEYTVKNGEFAITVDPENETLQARVKQARATRNAEKATVPFPLFRELDTNPFLNTNSLSIRDRLGMKNASDLEVFAELRKRKDRY